VAFVGWQIVLSLQILLVRRRSTPLHRRASAMARWCRWGLRRLLWSMPPRSGALVPPAFFTWVAGFAAMNGAARQLLAFSWRRLRPCGFDRAAAVFFRPAS
jgi:hypothetical protein